MAISEYIIQPICPPTLSLLFPTHPFTAGFLFPLCALVFINFLLPSFIAPALESQIQKVGQMCEREHYHSHLSEPWLPIALCSVFSSMDSEADSMPLKNCKEKLLCTYLCKCACGLAYMSVGLYLGHKFQLQYLEKRPAGFSINCTNLYSQRQ